MAFPILGNPKPSFFDSSGSPLASGTLAVLEPTDDTNKASYPTADDADASTNANTNPLTLDSRGEPSAGLYGRDGEKYKLVLKDSTGTIIWTEDDVQVPYDFYPTTSAETSAGVTPTNRQYAPGNILRYGTNTTPGTTDMTTAIQAAIDVASTAEATSVYVPSGIYECTSALTHTVGNGLRIYGDGRSSLIQNSTAGNTIELGDDITSYADCRVEHLTITNAVAGGACIYARKRSNLRIHHNRIAATGVGGYGVRLEESIAGSGCFNAFGSIKGYAWHVSDACHGFSISYNRCDGNGVDASTGIYATETAGLTIVGNVIESYFACGIYATANCHGMAIHGNYFESNGTTGQAFTGEVRTIKSDIIINGGTAYAINAGSPCKGVSVKGNYFGVSQSLDVDCSIYLIAANGFSEDSNYVLAYNSAASFIKTKNNASFYQNRKTVLGNSILLGASDKYFDVENINLTAATTFDEAQWTDIILQPNIAPRFDAISGISPQSYGIKVSATTTLAATVPAERYKGRQCFDITRSGAGTSHTYGVTVLEADHTDFYDGTLWLMYFEVKSITNTPGFEAAINVGTGQILSGGGSAVTTSFLPRTIVFKPVTGTDFTAGYRMAGGTGADVVRITRPVVCSLGSFSSLTIGDAPSVHTFTSTDATPSVKDGLVFATAGTTAITDFDDGQVGQTIVIIADASITITDNAAIILNGSANYTMTATDTLTLTMFDDQVWQEVARSVN